MASLKQWLHEGKCVNDSDAEVTVCIGDPAAGQFHTETLQSGQSTQAGEDCEGILHSDGSATKVHGRLGWESEHNSDWVKEHWPGCVQPTSEPKAQESPQTIEGDALVGDIFPNGGFMANDSKQLFAKAEDEEQDHLSETKKEFAEQQLRAPSEAWVDFPHNERTQEVRPQSPESQIGNWVHQYPEMFNESLSPPIPDLEKSDVQVPLPDPKGVSPALYADRVNFDDQIIREIKPKSQDAIEQGLMRNQTYKHRAEENFGGDNWTSEIHTYGRDELVEQNKWMDAAYHQTSDVAALDTSWPDTIDSDTLTPTSEVAALDTSWPDTVTPNPESSADHDSDPNVTQTERIEDEVVPVDTPESISSTSEVSEVSVPDASATETADANGLDSTGTNSSASADTGMADSGSSGIGDSSDSGAASADGSASSGAASADGSASSGAASADGGSSGVGDGGASGASGASGAADGGGASGASSGSSGSSGAAGGANGGAGSAGY